MFDQMLLKYADSETDQGIIAIANCTVAERGQPPRWPHIMLLMQPPK